MKTQTWIVISIFLAVIASGSLYLLNAAKKAERLAASPAERGWMLIEDNGCTSCHQNDSSYRAPSLAGLYGSKVTLSDGSLVTVDDAYVRESLLKPKAKVSAGYQATMPSYEGLLKDEEIALMIEALKPIDATPTKAEEAPGNADAKP
ncbi:MAG: c-type cytochrome [Oligoflexus sp.]|nr:c-type cytochrome [Oligoflexus sp.]